MIIDGPVVLVTGVAGGIGSAVARRFSLEGWTVFGTDLPDQHDFIDIDPLAVVSLGDVRRKVDCDRMLQGMLAMTNGQLDALVNCAGVWREGPVDELTEEDYELVMSVNTKGTVFMCAAAIPALKQSRGAIVNISSDAGRQGNLNAAAYCASKGAVTMFTKALALELAPFDVRANVVSPGDVDTGMLEFQAQRYGGGDRTGYRDALLRKYPQGKEFARFIEPDEVADLVLFLCSPGSKSITGADFAIDRGYSAGK